MKAVIFLILTILPCLHLEGRIIRVGRGMDFETIRSAATQSRPGDTILIKSGTYAGGEIIDNLRGTSSQWITIKAEYTGKVVFMGGDSGFHFSDPEYIRIEGFLFTKQTGNGVNIDDGGTFDTPAHHILIVDCEWGGLDATGNNDELKMSGVNDFILKECRFMNGSKGGSLIDLVGCHRGIIEKCYFGNGGSNCIQAKGGTSDLTIQQNRFIHGGERAINIGGSTGLQFFRPPGIRYEASEIRIWSNLFRGSAAAVAFVGAVNCEVVNNTIIQPESWVLRILQENNSTGMKACSDNKFLNNIIVFATPGRPVLNVGPHTSPETFIFSNNLWYNPLDSNWIGPDQPAKGLNSIINYDPEFSGEDYTLSSGSPALGNGFTSDKPEYDFFGTKFRKNRSIGAIEKSENKK